MTKSEIFFSRNTTQEMRTQITEVLGVTECIGTGKYLGLPSMIGRNKKQMFGYLRDRMWKRVQQWSGKHLSKAGREVLVKSVAQSIPTYCMSTFLLPTTLGEELEKMINSFWWGSNQNDRKGIHWLNWDKLTMRKEYGGMGFRHFHGFNLSLLGKQAWKLMTHTDTIVSRVFKAKYYPDSDFMGARLGHNPSYIWRSIYTSRVVVNLGSRWKLGDGKRVSVWGNPWLKGRKDAYVRSPMVMGTENMKVGELWNTTKDGWNEEMVDSLFTIHEASLIKKMPLYNFNEEDMLVWWRSRNGVYSVKSAYYGIMEELIDNYHLRIPGNWMQIWRLKIPPRVKIFLWRVARGCLPTRMNLRRRHIQCEEECSMCNEGMEDELHLFRNCAQAVSVWHATNIYHAVQQVAQQQQLFREWFFAVLESLSAASQAVFAMGLWAIWKRRNDTVWEGVSKPATVAVHLALDHLHAWEVARSRPNHTSTGTDPSNSSGRVFWRKPDAGTLKCNIDAALFNQENKYGIGMCIRDENGSFMEGKTMWFEGVPEPQEAEAMGLWHALNWLKDLSLESITIEMDCISVVNAVAKAKSRKSDFDVIVSHCNLLLSTLPSYRISFIRRQANLVAHSLARASRTYASSQVHYIAPSCITNIIDSEMI